MIFRQNWNRKNISGELEKPSHEAIMKLSNRPLARVIYSILIELGLSCCCATETGQNIKTTCSSSAVGCCNSVFPF